MEDIWIERRRHSQGFILPWHFEHSYQLLLPIEGRIRYRVGEKSYELGKGHIILLNTLEEHSLEVLSYPYERYILQVSPTFFQREVRYPEIVSIFVSRPATFSHCISLSEPMWERAMGILAELDREYHTQLPFWELCAGAEIRRLFVSLLRDCPQLSEKKQMDARTATAYKVMNHLDKHYLEDLSVDMVADALFLNKHYIAHAFKDATGYSIMDYVVTLRMNHAKSLLLETDMSVTEVAVDCGYSDFTYFSRVFRKKTGISPSGFRRKIREEEDEKNGLG